MRILQGKAYVSSRSSLTGTGQYRLRHLRERMQARHHCRLKQSRSSGAEVPQHQHRFFSLQISLLLFEGCTSCRHWLHCMNFARHAGGKLAPTGLYILIRGFSQSQTILGHSNGGSIGPYKVLSTTIISPLPARIIKSGLGLQLQCLASRLVIRIFRCVAVRPHVMCKGYHVGAWISFCVLLGCHLSVWSYCMVLLSLCRARCWDELQSSYDTLQSSLYSHNMLC